MLHGLLLLLLCVSDILAHSWMSCPRSFNTHSGRGGSTSPPCERFNTWLKGGDNIVKAGDRLKVGWTSNNHAGGYVRISLIKAKPGVPARNFFGASDAEFKQNVIKFACYGSDERPGKTKHGDCVHPCNGRPGCQYQSEKDDVERFDTTITVPTNLADGSYILQIAQLVGNAGAPYYSCAKLDVTGGKPNLNCVTQKPVTTYENKCHKSGGPTVDKIKAGTKRGNYCFHNDRIGDVDDRINEEPVNKECDPRTSCGLSVNRPSCLLEFGMQNIKNPNDPKQPNCKSLPRTTAAPVPTKEGIVTTVAPVPTKEGIVTTAAPVPTKEGIVTTVAQKVTPTATTRKPKPTPGIKATDMIVVRHTAREYGRTVDSRNGRSRIEILMLEDSPSKQWNFELEYNQRVRVGRPWGSSSRVTYKNPEMDIFKFESNSWQPKPLRGELLTIEVEFMKYDRKPLQITAAYFELGGVSRFGRIVKP